MRLKRHIAKGLTGTVLKRKKPGEPPKKSRSRKKKK
jgi:hypothetical protein